MNTWLCFSSDIQYLIINNKYNFKIEVKLNHLCTSFNHFLHLYFSFAFIAEKMFNQFDINIIIAVAFGVGVDAKFIGNYSSICLIQMMNLNEGFKKVKFDKSIF